MRILKKDIKEELLGLHIRGSQDAGRLRNWIVDNMQQLFPGKDLAIVDANIYDTDHMRAYLVKVVECSYDEIHVPAWSFLGITSRKFVPTRVRRETVLLNVQLGTFDEVQLGTIDTWESAVIPIVTSESGVYVS